MEDGDEDETKPSTSSMLPAQPKNGHMRTYENPARTFTRPYSAKTVYFYKEGDLFFTGLRIPISHHRFKTMNNVMDEINRNIYLPYGVRTITTPMGRTVIQKLDDFEHLGRYVASSSNPPKGVDLNKIQEKYSATQRRGEPTRSAAAANSYWMPTTPAPPPARFNMAYLFRTFQTISSKQIMIVLNGKGKFHKAMINPMKMPTMDQLLDECSTALGTAIHRLYTPQGKLIATVDEILAHDGPRIIACPRSERPHLSETANAVKLPDIHPSRYAPRMPFQKVVESSSSASNSIEKPVRLPVISNHRLVTKKPKAINEKNGTVSPPKPFARHSSSLKKGAEKAAETRSRATVTSSATKLKKLSSIDKSETTTTTTAETEENVEEEEEKKKKKSGSRGSNPKDSGNGNSISSSQQSGRNSERPASMTEKKAQMIRNELLANLAKPHINSDHYSEEDRILEEDSDYDHVGGAIESGTEDEEEDSVEHGKDSALGSTRKVSEHATPAHRTPSTSSSEPAELTRRKSTSKSRKSRTTPSRQTTANSNSRADRSSSGSSRPKSTYSSRPVTRNGKVIEEREREEEEREKEEKEEEEEEDELEEADEERETPAVHTPDTRVETRLSTSSSLRSYASESSKAWSRISRYSDKEQILPSGDEEEEKGEEGEDGNVTDAYRDIGTAERERLGEAASRIQRAFKKYKKRVQFERDQMEHERNLMSYTVEIMIGQRFGIDFDTPIYVILNGEDGKSSERVWTQRPPWLLTEPDAYAGGTWLLSETRTEKLGIITSVTVGHENEGYGAGTYIERVVVTEQPLDGRIFQFPVEKWLDAGQVDGLIERNVRLSSFLYLQADKRTSGHVPRTSKGRWEFRLHTMESDMGGTTSNLTVIGFGEYDSHSNIVKNDSLLRDAYSVPVIQLDFGTDIGKLLKVRFEIDGGGDRPHYYLEYVEAQDLDTRERCVVYVSNWMLADAIPGYRKWQPFREIAIFTKEYWPQPTRTYEGTVHFGDTSLIKTDDTPMFIQYMSESKNMYGRPHEASGLVPIVPIPMKDGSINWCFKVDFISGESTHGIRVMPPITELGTDILSGLSVMGDVYKEMARNKVIKNEGACPFAPQLFIERIDQKSGDHVPYIINYAKSTVDYEANHQNGPYFKQMNAMVGEKRATARKWKKSGERPRVESSTISWHLLMRLEEPRLHECHNIIVPSVQLVAKDRTTFEMDCLNADRPDTHAIFIAHTPDGPVYEHVLVLQYSCSVKNFGMPAKIRLSCEEPAPDEYTFITKMKLVEKTTKTEVYFKVNDQLNGFDTIELECYYPDLGSNQIKIYEVRITTTEGGGDFRPFVNLIGSDSDTGHRAYPGVTKWDTLRDGVDFEINYGVNLGELERIEIWAKYGNPKNWKGKFEVCEVPSGKFYESGIVELSKNGQIALSELKFLGILEKREEEEGETAI